MIAKPLCIYHGNCADGFGAAWVVRKVYGENVDFHAGFYGQEPPSAAGRNVLLVDFSYKAEILRKMASEARSILILDHHKSAEADLSHMLNTRIGDCFVEGVFDMNRSGAMVTWDWFFPHEPAPKLLEHIEDRDLWRFHLPHTREIQANLFSYPYDFEVWDGLMSRPVLDLVVEGQAIERKHQKDVQELLGVTRRRMIIGGVSVPTANLPYTMASDAGHILGEGEPFAATYYDAPDARIFSLRSAVDGMDVSIIAKQYGGGGHARASGFRAPPGWEGDSV